MQKWRASDCKIKIIKDITIGEQKREREKEWIIYIKKYKLSYLDIKSVSSLKAWFAYMKVRSFIWL
jgi:hypothetical protein